MFRHPASNLKRILQALAADRLFRVLTPFARGYGPNANPRRGVLLSLAIALATVGLGKLNLIAPVVTMFFLICVRPFVRELRNSVRAFWFAQNVMWFQIIFFFGFILAFFVLFEPKGLNGRWLKIKAFFQTFPLYRKDVFRRGKTYMKSERYR